ncbi:alpha/beta hydrolase [Amorphoplanes digitatis]|uniref:Pimeloyl-ACP methyl ester carboxylesterase n=1 Tax=Actinoplanes digitatis TaxID=1868 RepID=A0A7W7MS81_9ACTN|nr:alpha/beta hydrolase-fold protein [Actinoplanes digitatis]MBB4764390.1 pimeloyl-ACP methyl ester carboxylesterase [Actinoplanes digitatis]
MRRRTVLTALGATAAIATLGGVYRGRAAPPPTIPGAPIGDERLDRRRSAARGRTVDFYTAVPAGHGDGRGLPVLLVLHGASTTAADFPRLGLGRFASDSVRRGNAPFVLAGATGDRLSWRPSGTDDPQRMVHEEIPAWCAERGFDTTRVAVCGWSMGGYGALLLAGTFPGFVRAVAAFSPAVHPGDDVFARAAGLRDVPVGLWCGTDDGLLPEVRALEKALPRPKAAGTYSAGGHNFGYWSTCLPAAFDLIAAHSAEVGTPART